MVPKSLLVINPNSSQAITDSLRPIVQGVMPSDVKVSFFTAPPSAPQSIDNAADSAKSADVCLPALTPLLDAHGAFLVACYSEHPLVTLLRQYTSKPVIGIFEASISHALMLRGNGKWGIITTGKVWEDLLSVGVGNFVGEDPGGFEGVESTGVNCDQLHQIPQQDLEQRIWDAVLRLLSRGDVRVICLGCAGMAGFESIVEAAVASVGKKCMIIDGVKSGVVQLVGLMRCQYHDPGSLS